MPKTKAKSSGTGNLTRSKKSKAIRERALLLGDTVRQLRLGRDWSQTDLAHQAGLSRQLLSLIENGNANCTYETLIRLFTAFNLNCHLLLLPLDAPESLRGEVTDFIDKALKRKAVVAAA